jgi:8-oxo-dGTP pyrophosphatase MutT (NUDIX family)
MRAQILPHRATFVVVEHPDTNNFYVQKRTLTKDVFPGFFDPCPGGVVQADEPDSLLSATREIEEEMGITGVQLTHLFNAYYDDQSVKLWCHVFHTMYKGDLVI